MLNLISFQVRRRPWSRCYRPRSSHFAGPRVLRILSGHLLLDSLSTFGRKRNPDDNLLRDGFKLGRTVRTLLQRLLGPSDERPGREHGRRLQVVGDVGANGRTIMSENCCFCCRLCLYSRRRRRRYRCFCASRRTQQT